MKIVVPTEVKNNEFRVAITPVGVHELVRRGHEVFVQQGAGLGSSINDEDVCRSGCHDRRRSGRHVAAGEMVLKVKEPIEQEYSYLRDVPDALTYLHLAAEGVVRERDLFARTRDRA
ncbi:hypothetical protein BJF82_15775 [Kytococcus sp. CUA-901]|nr:hypothetical protein BJF82_15775 [Kytococcus sp. CUA-901]